MKRWAILVAALYVLILFVLALPVSVAAFTKGAPDLTYANMKGALEELIGYWFFWTWLVVMIFSQLALLVVPVKFASRRPVTRGPLFLTVLASGLMMGVMAGGVVLAVYEFAKGDSGLSTADAWLTLGVALLTWCLWSLIFFRLGQKTEPGDFIQRQSRALLRGSVLELLVAVPTHIVARHRDYCCAGLMTFVGLAMGISVMLFSFGPAVFFLFIERWKRLHPRAGGDK